MEWLLLYFRLSWYPSILWKILAEVILWNSWCSNILQENVWKVLRSVFYIFYIYFVCILNSSFEYMWIVMNTSFYFRLNVSWHWFLKIYPADRCKKVKKTFNFKHSKNFQSWLSGETLRNFQLWTFIECSYMNDRCIYISTKKCTKLMVYHLTTASVAPLA